MNYPFGGAESPENNPYQYTRVGIIADILDENNFVTGTTQSNPNAYFSVKIMWLDRGGMDGNFEGHTCIIPLSYTHIGRGHGLLYKPSKGDIVSCSFRMGGYPVIDKFLPIGNYYNMVNGVDEKGYYHRHLIDSGEYDLKSKMGAEVYLDKMGSLHLLTRDQTQTTEATYNNGIEEIKDTIVADMPQVEVVLGKTYDYKQVGNTNQFDFTQEVKSSTGNSTRLSIQDYTSNVKIIIDTSGNIEIVQPSGSKFTVTGSDEADILGTQQLALLSEIKALTDKYNELVSIFNAHTHGGVTSGGSFTSATVSQGSSSAEPNGTQRLKGS